ncbi:putative proteinC TRANSCRIPTION FACTOR 56 [Salix purpurea]|uniref:NAC domain-containing protein n=1 Tax=Salix purpurea TaxID=77065 RepID=A0A9Q0PPB6_SALPP|nr:putative proteinC TRANSCRIPTION FACTOR 56 [Salix purpurea]
MSSLEENSSESPTMEFTEESMPEVHHSPTTPIAPNIPSNSPASPTQIPITSTSSPPPPAPVPHPPSAIASPSMVLQPPPPLTLAAAPAPPRFSNDRDNDRYFKSFPPGFRFCPHDHELVLYYLTKKVRGLPLPRNKIVDVILYQYDPEYLADRYKHFGEKEWYFFTPRDRKYKNGSRPNRAANGGYWKATGADKNIIYNQAVVGYRKALVYYTGKAPKGDKTNWIMHEFRVNDPLPQVRNHRDEMRLDDWVLCRIYKKHEKSNNVRNGQRNEERSDVSNEQRNEEHSSGSLDEIGEDYIHDHNSNDLAAMGADYAGEIYDMGAGSLENALPVYNGLSQQPAAPRGFSDSFNFSTAPACHSRTLRDTQVPNLAETFGNPAPMFPVNPDNWPYRQNGYPDEFLNLTHWSQVNIPGQFFDLHSVKPTYLPRNPAPLVNLLPTGTILPAHGLPYLNTAPPGGRLPPINTARPAGRLPPTNTALLTRRHPANIQPASLTSVDAKLTGHPPRHL